MEVHWKFLGGGGGGVIKVKVLKAKYEVKLEFPGGMGGAKQKNLPWGGGGVWIFSGTAQSSDV